MLNKTAIEKLIPISTMKKYDISIAGLCMVLAQCDHESAGFTHVTENLNYSADRLLVIFKKYFTRIDAEQYARNPEKIANRVYANRMGNHDESSGDGFKYRGRGYIQLTGIDNYARCGESLGLDLVNNPDLLCLPDHAITSAIWFFHNNHIINNLDIEKVTRKINGGIHGLEDRTKLFKAYSNLF